MGETATWLEAFHGENLGKTLGKSWESHETHGKLGKIYGKLGKNGNLIVDNEWMDHSGISHGNGTVNQWDKHGETNRSNIGQPLENSGKIMDLTTYK